MPLTLVVSCCFRHRTCCALVIAQTDSRAASIEVKIAKLDGDLLRCKDQMAKLRNGPGKVGSAPYGWTGATENGELTNLPYFASSCCSKASIQQRAMAILKQKKMYAHIPGWASLLIPIQFPQVRSAACAIDAANIQHGDVSSLFLDRNVT